MHLQAEKEGVLVEATKVRTIWGLDTLALHDQYWAAHGLQVIRPGVETPICPNAIGYLLLSRDLMVLFSPDKFKDRQAWLRCDMVYLRMHEASSLRERVVTDDAFRFVRFERSYQGTRSARTVRVAVTRDPRLAALWQIAPNVSAAVKKLRQLVTRERRSIVSTLGSVYDFKIESGRMTFLRDLMRVWANPQAAIRRAVAHEKSVWLDAELPLPTNTQFVGPVWVGAGRKLDDASMVIGPAVLWDDPAARPAAQDIVVDPVGTAVLTAVAQPAMAGIKHRRVYHMVKRLFDVTFALAGLLFTLPIYPLVMLAIWLEDGRPFFFAHRRETLYGRKFGCIKFRSMQKNAEKIKLNLAAHNQADGPQFFMESDPRLTRVGQILRQCHLDELPQFINVLLGHMSVVGPRPSPFKENQFCPPWREARLSVRPGITGLWQVKRTREKDKDFQEWIRYDIEYVEKSGLLLDGWIVLQTIANVLGRLGSTVFRRGGSKGSSSGPAESHEPMETPV